MSNIKAAIQIALAQKGMSQRDLAKKMRVTEGAVHHWAVGDRDLRIGTINKIAKALRMKTSQLLALGE